MIICNKKVLVLGLMRSGIAVAKLLYINGAEIILCDQNNNEKIQKNLEDLQGISYDLQLGVDPITLLDKVDILVISPGVPIDSNVVKTAKSKGVKVYGELEIASRFCKNTILAVTGTNGKTTSVSLLGKMFENAGKISVVAGNIGYPLSSAVMNAKPGDVIVCEVSSFQLESISKFKPKSAAILNITNDHLNRHKTMEEYTRLKFRIFENQKEEDYSVLNFDDEIIRKNYSKLKSKLIWFSVKEKLDEGIYLDGNKIFIKLDNTIQQVCLKDEIMLPGEHNLQNALAMIAIAYKAGIPIAVIRHTLRTFEGVEHRIETVAIKNEVKYINDSKGTNVDSTIQAVKAMITPTVIIMGGYDKATDFSPLCKLIASSKNIKYAVLIGQTAEQISSSLKDVGFNNICFAKDMEDAVKQSSSLAKNGYNVLLSPACASFDMFEDYEQRGRVFKEIVNRL